MTINITAPVKEVTTPTGNSSGLNSVLDRRSVKTMNTPPTIRDAGSSFL
jgi:hypothetical protein